MTDQRESAARPSVRRILAAFDASTAEPEAIEAAVEFAARLGAELEILFVEDSSLRDAAALPFVQQVGRYGVTSFAVNDLDTEVRALLARAQRRLADAARRRRVTWTVRTVRGSLATEITGTSDVDLVVLQSTLRPPMPHVRVRSDVRRIVRRVGGPALILGPGAAPRPPVTILYEDEEKGERLMAAAASLCRSYACAFEILLPPSSEPGASDDERAARAVALARRFGFDPTVTVLRGTGIVEAMERARGGILVAAEDSPLLRDDEWDRACRGACALLVVR